jgi:peptidyl-tRNA hydrolase
MAAKVLIQYIVVRGDLMASLNWPMGAVIAQACHASSAAIHLHLEDQHVKEYMKHIDSMHKVVLQVKNEDELRQLSADLEMGGVHHKMWVEQPENYPTCIATKPHPKSDIQKYFKKFKLFA